MSNRVNFVPPQKVSCYFCNNLLDENYLFDHVKHCGSVLEECTFNCGVYVPRKNMKDHRKTCNRNMSKGNNQLLEVEDFLWRNKVFSALALLRSIISHEEKERNSLQDNMSRCLNFLYSQQESIDTLRFQIVDTMEESRRYNRMLSQRLNDLEVTCDNIEQRTSVSFQQISKQLSLLHEELNEQNKHGEVFDDWSLELKDTKTFFTAECAHIKKMWQEQQQLIHDLKLELEMRCKSSNDLMERQEHTMEKINNLEEEMQEQSANITDEKANIKELKFQMKESLKYLEELIRDNEKVNVARSIECAHECFNRYPTNGRLLWRVDGYKKKLADAKENGGALYSQPFSNEEYGYTLRMELFLNGIGQWKDRHIIGCLRVEAGQWDPLLVWPCVLKATVTLRNQENPASEIKKVVKAVGQDKFNSKDVTKESGTYMFIPHTAMARYSGYIKDDAVFLDIQVKDIRTSASASSLML